MANARLYSALPANHTVAALHTIEFRRLFRVAACRADFRLTLFRQSQLPVQEVRFRSPHVSGLRHSTAPPEFSAGGRSWGCAGLQRAASSQIVMARLYSGFLRPQGTGPAHD